MAPLRTAERCGAGSNDCNLGHWAINGVIKSLRAGSVLSALTRMRPANSRTPNGQRRSDSERNAAPLLHTVANASVTDHCCGTPVRTFFSLVPKLIHLIQAAVEQFDSMRLPPEASSIINQKPPHWESKLVQVLLVSASDEVNRSYEKATLGTNALGFADWTRTF
jgi:hypothetical protein